MQRRLEGFDPGNITYYSTALQYSLQYSRLDVQPLPVIPSYKINIAVFCSHFACVSKMNIAVAVSLFAAVVQVSVALPGGPPVGACTNIFPVGHTNPANEVDNPTDNENNPYQLNLDAFLNASDTQSTTLLYSPGVVYEREFTQ